MKILALDLELNQANTGPKIIEIGACVGNVLSGEILESYSAFVNPGQILEESIVKLTGITQEQVDSGSTIEEAYLGMIALARRHDCLTMPLVWGMHDGDALRLELPTTCQWELGRRELDVKAVFQAYQMAKGEKVQAGLAKALTRLGLQFKGKKHRAVDDAINTLLIFSALLKQFH